MDSSLSWLLLQVESGCWVCLPVEARGWGVPPGPLELSPVRNLVSEKLVLCGAGKHRVWGRKHPVRWKHLLPWAAGQVGRPGGLGSVSSSLLCLGPVPSVQACSLLLWLTPTQTGTQRLQMVSQPLEAQVLRPGGWGKTELHFPCLRDRQPG